MNNIIWYKLIEKLPEDRNEVYFQLVNGTFYEGYYLTCYKIGQRKDEEPADKWFTLLDDNQTYQLDSISRWAYKNEL